MTIAQTLEVVCGLVSSMEVVMEGAHCLLVWLVSWYEIQIRVGGKASTDDIRQALGTSS